MLVYYELKYGKPCNTPAPNVQILTDVLLQNNAFVRNTDWIIIEERSSIFLDNLKGHMKFPNQNCAFGKM